LIFCSELRLARVWYFFCFSSFGSGFRGAQGSRSVLEQKTNSAIHYCRTSAEFGSASACTAAINPDGLKGLVI
jgi:hypothetical protein